MLLQKEVVNRLVAEPGTKAFGRLSVLTQWLCQASSAFDIPPTAFIPPPKVMSAVAVYARARAIKDRSIAAYQR